MQEGWFDMLILESDRLIMRDYKESDLTEYHKMMSDKENMYYLYDIIFSRGVFHFIKPELRDEIINDYKQHTNIGGINAFNVFVDKPFITGHPDFVKHSYLWRSGLLLSYYHDWLIEDFSEYIADFSEFTIDDISTDQYTETINQIYARRMV